MTQTVIINTDEKPISEKHVAFFAYHSLEERTCVIGEVVEATYNHPDCPEHAVIRRLETRSGKRVKLMSSEAAAIELVRLADENMQEVRRKYFLENI